MNALAGFSRRRFLKSSAAGVLAAGAAARAEAQERPNILWITSEDNGPFLGCYGDAFATTPNLDRLASEGVLYENAFANAPVCAPARSTILTGMYACSMGTHHMRSRYAIPEFIRPYPDFLREAGYYCANQKKTDYNIRMDDKAPWDECSVRATYRQRKPGQPFFAIINLGVTHESSIHKTQETTKHDPAGVSLPPYHPDTPEIRHDWAQYYDKIETLDGQVGEILERLESDGLAGDTIVFYYSDHGGVVCRSKRFVYDSGTHVPMMVRFPKNYQHLAPGKPGTRTDRLVSFVDLAPTLLSLAGVKVPGYMQGEAFLGGQQRPPREYVYLFRGRMDERYDMMRAVRDKRFKYIRNYMPHRIYGQYLQYLWKAPSTRSWEAEFKAGRCNEAQRIFWGTKPPEEVYDTSADPWEVNNLADDPVYVDVLKRMRAANRKWVREIRDPGFIPEGEMVELSEGKTSFDLVREPSFPLDRIIETAEMATLRDPALLPELRLRLDDEQASVRFWAATGCAVLGEQAKAAEGLLCGLLTDDCGDVRVAAAEAVHGLGERTRALDVLSAELKNPNSKVALRAANVLEALGAASAAALPAIEAVHETTTDDYVKRAALRLLSQLKPQ
ncbi:MAG: sulfatase-like hydrolase/transferase [Nitrospiraceae bacterium]|nr:sulfatase-like hydrolase/transferase [Nitrospiraceae bacterium]